MAMIDDLRQLLVSNMVPQECIDLLETEGCINMKLFSKWAPDRASMQALVLDKCPTYKASVQALAALLQTFDEAVAIVTEMTRRSSAGLDPDSVDEPLLHAVQQALEAKFMKKYSWQLEPKYQPANAMLGRVKREFDKLAPTIFNVTRVRTVFTSNKQQEPKRRKLATGVTFTFEQDGEEEDQQALKYRHVFHKYGVLAMCWAMAGNYEVMHEGSKTDFVTWQQSQRYVRTLREKTELLLDSHEEESVVRYLLSVEEQLRGFAVEYTRRSESVPWGLALEQALRDNRDLWSDFKHLLRGHRGAGEIRSIDSEDLPVPHSVQAPGKTSKQLQGSPRRPQHQQQSSQQQQQGSPRKAQQQQQQGNSKGSGGQKGQSTGALHATATHTASGSSICKAWNDARGCSKPCSQGRAHVCDTVLLKGSVCGRSDHNRRGHNPALHGAPAPRK